MPRGNKEAFIKTGVFKCECGREFEKSRSLYGHQSHCRVHLGDRFIEGSRYHTIYGNYKCVCGREFNNSSSYIGHTPHCEIYLGEERYLKNKEAFSNGQKFATEAARTSHTKESREQQSKTRKQKYLTGELSPALGSGRGTYSYIIYHSNKILLRSTYEFIYALYLAYNLIDFDYESIRVEYNDHVYISDFNVGNKVIEIKGDYHADISQQKLAFELSGYQYEVKFWKDLEPCYQYLKSKIDIDHLLELIKSGHNSKNYFVYNLDEYNYLP